MIFQSHKHIQINPTLNSRVQKTMECARIRHIQCIQGSKNQDRNQRDLEEKKMRKHLPFLIQYNQQKTDRSSIKKQLQCKRKE